VTYPSQFKGRSLISMAGESLSSVLCNTEKQAPRVLVWPKAVRYGDWKLVLEKGRSPELYRISQDRNEKRNVAAEFPDQVSKLLQIHAKNFSRR
jgi:hypothetical protein